MRIKNDSVLPKPSDERMESFERYCGVSLPVEFKEFIIKYNGAVPITNVFVHNETEYMIERFLCLLDEPNSNDIHGWYDIEMILAQIDTRLTDDVELAGANVIPFASLFAGDFVCVDLRDKNIQKVLIWFHEESEDFYPVTESVADNIEQFLSMLTE